MVITIIPGVQPTLEGAVITLSIFGYAVLSFGIFFSRYRKAQDRPLPTIKHLFRLLLVPSLLLSLPACMATVGTDHWWLTIITYLILVLLFGLLGLLGAMLGIGVGIGRHPKN